MIQSLYCERLLHKLCWFTCTYMQAYVDVVDNCDHNDDDNYDDDADDDDGDDDNDYDDEDNCDNDLIINDMGMMKLL